MREAVLKILEGNFNHGIRSLDFSSPVIELTLHEGENYEGSFTIFGPENTVTEGTVSSTRLRMKCLVSRFSGPREEIPYRFDAAGMVEGEILKGEFRIISNQGEYFVPYEVRIGVNTLESSLGGIRNLFHFTNLARTNWDEAVNLFYSKDFGRILEGADRQYYPVYRGLTQGKRGQQNVEEFLLEIKKKQQIEYILEETEIRLDDPRGMVENKIIITRNGWGCSELYIEKNGDFITVEKEIIRDEDFLGNCYRLPFYVSEDRLHAGRNYGSIRLYNAYVSLEVKVIVVSRQPAARIASIRRQKKHTILEMMQYYEAFRTRKISSASWLKETGDLVERLIEMDDKDPSFKLFQVQLLITQERYNEAQWFLTQVDEMLVGNFEPTLYCYYLYLTTLLNRQEEHIDEVAGQVERIFTQNERNWRIAWLLMYLSEDYSRSPSKKWLMLEQQYRHGASSPVIYVEAWNLLAANPTLLMKLEGFELQVLLYAARKELMVPAVAEQTVYLSMRQRSYDARLFEVLKACYVINPSDESLQAICTLLINGNIAGAESFPWYEKGIEKELRITRLYEYYMMSLPLEEERMIPRIVLMYFAFDSSLDSLRNSYLYAYVHRNKEQYPELYASYREQIERFVVFQILKGRSNRWLAYLYKNLITPDMITEENAQGLAVALFIHRLVIKRRDVRRVILIYEKELEEVSYPIQSQEVYLPVYGKDYRLLLEDGNGNRYCREEDYELERLLVPDALAALAAPYVVEDIHFDLWLCQRGRELTAISPDNQEAMKRIADSDLVLEEVRKEIRMRLIHYYYDSDRMKELDDFLESLTPDQVDGSSFVQVVRFMVIRGMYEKAYAWIHLRGGGGIDAKLIVRLCSRMIALEGMTEDETMTALAHMAFEAGKYDESLLTYLCSFFTGTTKEMRNVWKAAQSFGVDTYGLSERMLIQMMYTGAYIGERMEIFRSYVSGGAKTEIELAFLAQCAFDYFVKEKVTDRFVMEDMQRVIERQEEDFPLVCKMAYTKYYAENKKLVDERVSRYLIIFLRELLNQNKVFAYFKEYADNITFMRRFLDKTIVEYKAKEGNQTVIHYLVEGGSDTEGEYRQEEMQDMFCGICVSQFILFFGEKLQYYITETENGKEQLTESGTYSRNDTDRDQRESKYNLINDIAIGRTLHDYDTMEALLYEYFDKEYTVKELFDIL